MIAFIRLEIVLDHTGPCGALALTHSFSSAEPSRKVTILTSFLRASTGHKRGFQKFFNRTGRQRTTLLRFAFLRRVVNEKRTASSEKTNDLRSIAAISATLQQGPSVTRVTAYPDSIESGNELFEPSEVRCKKNLSGLHITGYLGCGEGPQLGDTGSLPLSMQKHIQLRLADS